MTPFAVLAWCLPCYRLLLTIVPPGLAISVMKKLILIEFNELCPALLARWMAEGKLPNFSKFHARSDVFTTRADEPEGPNLEPWIQWYSLHTGIPFSQHNVFHLTDGPRAAHPDIWSILSANGLSVWNCSSMNARRITAKGARYLPDPWCDSELPFPPEMQAYYKIVSQQVKEYSNRDHGVSVSDLSNFLRFMATHGLSAATVNAIVKQLAGEKFGARDGWKRAVLLDMLQFDVFRHYFRKEKPDFSTFFVNSTAHLQHSYWRHMAPEAFSVRPADGEIAANRDAILFGYQKMDALLGRFMALAGNDTTLIFASALSQQPYLKYEAIGGHHFYRPREVNKLLDRLHIAPERVEPVMTHQFVARFRTEAEKAEAQRRLGAVTSNGQQVFGFDDADATSLYFGCQLRTQLAKDATLELGGNEPPVGFFEWLYQIEGMKSGRHHPDGCLWIRQGAHRVVEERVSILDVLPTVLSFFGLSAKGYPGRTLIGEPEPIPAAAE
jgi:hypothetical protein